MANVNQSRVDAPGDYAAALAAEQKIYANCTEVHDLPPSFHYWSNRYLRPQLQAHGFESPQDLFLDVLRRQCTQDAPVRFLSVGAGNGDLELALAAQLRAERHDNFVLECLDLNPQMLARGRAAADAAGLGKYLAFVQADFNHWRATHRYHAVLANQSLHHVVNLEGLLSELRRALVDTGELAVSDMIGRNGHQRWPEALAIVQEFWTGLPPSYRFNLRRLVYEERFVNWDCSGEGFEGIRSQDILPLLLEHFHFKMFLPFGNLIDPFVDRTFGGHFDVASAWDRAFLDRVHARDEAELAAGRLTPTHLLAILTKEPAPHAVAPQTVRRCIRRPSAPPTDSSPPPVPYEWGAWPHAADDELRRVCQYLAAADQTDLLRERTLWALRLQDELQERTGQTVIWQQEAAAEAERGRALAADLRERTAWALSLEAELDSRTAWAQDLLAERDRYRAALAQAEADLAARTAWAQSLDVELNERTRWAQQLEQERDAERQRADHLAAILRHPLRTLRHWLTGLRG